MSLVIQSPSGAFELDEATETFAFFDDDFGNGLPGAPYKSPWVLEPYWNGWTDAVVVSSGAWAGSGGHTTGVFKNVRPQIIGGQTSYGYCVSGDRGGSQTVYSIANLPDASHTFRVVYDGNISNPKLVIGHYDISLFTLGANHNYLWITSRKLVGGALLWHEIPYRGNIGNLENHFITVEPSSNSGATYYFYIALASYITNPPASSYVESPPLQMKII